MKGVGSPASRLGVPELVAVISCMTVFTLLLGLSYPLLSLILERQGYSEGLIGANAAMAPLGVIMSSFYMPHLSRWLGPVRLVAVSVVCSVVLFLLIGAFQDVWLWFPLRFLLGIAINGTFVVAETWINQMAGQATRGRVLGAYTMSISLGFALGPLLLTFTGTGGWLPFICGASVAAFALLPLYIARNNLPAISHERAAPWAFVRQAPVLLYFILAVAAMDQAGLSLLPIYFLRHGLEETDITLALSIFIAGNIVFQPLVGWIIDWAGTRMAAVLCTSSAIAGCFLLPYSLDSTAGFGALLFIWGGLTFGLYTVGLSQLGQRFTGAMLLVGNAAFAAMWGLGGIVSAPVAGQAMQTFGPGALLHLLALVFLVGLILAIFSREHTRR